MARIIYPETFAAQVTLLSLIAAKHTADGGTSVLTAMLAQKGITLATDIATGTSATTHEASRALLRKQSENFKQLQGIQFNPVFGHVRSAGGYLKSYYKPSVNALGDWGYTISNNNRIDYQADFTSRTQLFINMKAKHDSFTAPPSPLTTFLTQQAINLTTDNTAVTNAISNAALAASTAEQSENERETRNNLWNPVLGHIKTIGDFLIKTFPNNPQKLGLWGFVVDESPRAAKLRTSTVNLADQITIRDVRVGGTFTNTGTVDLHVYKGTTTTGTPIIVHPGEQLGMMKGYSTITVINPSTLVSGKFTVLAGQ